MILMEAMKFLYLFVAVSLFRLAGLVLGALSFVHPFLQKRKIFEKRNSDEGSISFYRAKVRAHITFHISSEGELEQARPLIDSFIQRAKRVEIIFTSESVESKIKKIYEAHPEQVRYLRFPILCNFRHWRPFNWVTSEHFIMVRYDFFPELLLMSRFCERMTLLWATRKGKSEEFNFFEKLIYSFFSHIVPATTKDETLFKKSFDTVQSAFDFRVLQINKRVQNARAKMEENKLTFFVEFLESNFKKEDRIVFGSAWPVDNGAFNDDFILAIKEKKKIVCLCPHKLNEQSVKDIVGPLEEKGLEVYKITKDTDANILIEHYKKDAGIFINLIPSVLCEFYSLFGHAYVSGGFGRSIHSVLEPYLGGAFTYCGPRTHRSTEFDLVNENDESALHRIDDITDLYRSICAMNSQKFNDERVKSFVDSYRERYDDIIMSL